MVYIVVLIRILVFMAAVAMTAQTALAQNISNSTRVWGAVGIGAAAPSSGGDGIANVAQVVHEYKSNVFALRGVIVHDIERPTNELGEVGILYGRSSPVKSFAATLAAGLSGVGFSACPDDDDSCFTIGLPIVAEVSWRSQFVGIGFQSFGNINPKATYAGGVVFVQLGRLR